MNISILQRCANDSGSDAINGNFSAASCNCYQRMKQVLAALLRGFRNSRFSVHSEKKVQSKCFKSFRELVVPIRCLQRKERSLLALELQFSVVHSFSAAKPFRFDDNNFSFIMIKYNLQNLIITKSDNQSQAIIDQQ